MNLRTVLAGAVAAIVAMGITTIGTAAPAQATRGGYDAYRGQYPGMLSLTLNGKLLCGATLISTKPGQPIRALTAAHCLRSQDFSKIVVRGGSLYWDRGDETTIRRAFAHPGFDGSFSGIGDVAVIELNRVPQGARPIPVAKPYSLHAQDFYRSGTQVTIAGWGNFDPSKPLSSPSSTEPEKLHSISVSILPHHTCGKDATFVMCARTTKKKSTLGGDSGGPWIAQGVLIGIHVQNTRRKKVPYQSIAVRVDALHDWLAGLDEPTSSDSD